MDYICIRNKNEVVFNDLFLIGSSTKRGDTSKIGMFGSGWKYAIACLLRNDIKLQVFSGTRELKIDTVPTKHRDMNVKVITIDGIQTSMTTDMGTEWQVWMALREIFSNAIDEEDYSISIDSEITPEPGYTTVYIESVGAVTDIINNMSDYFAFNRRPNIVVKYVSAIHSSNATLKLYAGTNKNTIIYRRGIKALERRVEANVPFDMDFSHLIIDENRLTNFRYIRAEFEYLFDTATDLEMDTLLALLISYNELFGMNMITNTMSDTVKSLIIQASNNGIEFVSHTINTLIAVAFPNAISLPHQWYYDLVEDKVIEDKTNILLFSGCPRDFVPFPSIEFDLARVNKLLSIVLPDYKAVTGKFQSPYDTIRIDYDAKVIYADYTLNPGGDEKMAGLILQKFDYSILGTILAHLENQLKTVQYDN